VYLGAALICASLLIMIGLLADRAAMERIMDADAWFVLTALLAPVGYVLQDVVADAMTVEAVPRFDEEGRPTPEDARKLMHTTMQTLGRVAIIGGTVLVAARTCGCSPARSRWPRRRRPRPTSSSTSSR